MINILFLSLGFASPEAVISAATTEIEALARATAGESAGGSSAAASSIFPPHITLVSGIVGFQRDAIDIAREVASNLSPFDICFCGEGAFQPARVTSAERLFCMIHSC